MSDGYLPQLPWQAEAWQAIAPLLARGAHAILLHGAAGIGKKSLALDLARAVLCESPQTDGHACGVCAGCRLTAAGSHPDLRIVVPDTMAVWRGPEAADAEAEADDAEPAEAEGVAEPAGKGKRLSREIRIEQVRGLADFVATSTHRGGRRVVVLAPAELLNGPSANALLKMLEEPPAGSLFVLVADALDEVLPTIRSRSVLLRVAAPAPATALAWLCAQGVADAAEALAAAGGAPLAALAQGTGAALDPALRQTLIELLGRGPRLDAAAVAAAVPKTVPVAPTIALLQRWGWDLLALSTLRQGGAVRYHPGAASALTRIAGQTDAGAVLGWLARLAGHRRVQDHPLNAKLAVETALLQYLECFERPPR